MSTTGNADPWSIIPDGDWTLVKDAGKDVLRPGLHVRVLLLGGSVAHNNLVPSVLHGVIHAPENNPGTLYVGPTPLSWWNKFQIVEE